MGSNDFLAHFNVKKLFIGGFTFYKTGAVYYNDYHSTKDSCKGWMVEQQIRLFPSLYRCFEDKIVVDNFIWNNILEFNDKNNDLLDLIKYIKDNRDSIYISRIENEVQCLKNINKHLCNKIIDLKYGKNKSPSIEQPTKKVENKSPSIEQPTKKVENKSPSIEQPIKKVENKSPSIEQPIKKVKFKFPVSIDNIITKKKKNIKNKSAINRQKEKHRRSRKR